MDSIGVDWKAVAERLGDELEQIKVANPPMALRCGVCFRDLSLPSGKDGHTLFGDGSVLCLGGRRGWVTLTGPQVRALIEEVRDGW